MTSTDGTAADEQPWKPMSMQELWSARESLTTEQPWKPVARARLLWSLRRVVLRRLNLPQDQQHVVVKAVRRAAVYRAVAFNVDAVARGAGRAALLWLSLAGWWTRSVLSWG